MPREAEEMEENLLVGRVVFAVQFEKSSGDRRGTHTLPLWHDGKGFNLLPLYSQDCTSWI